MTICEMQRSLKTQMMSSSTLIQQMLLSQSTICLCAICSASLPQYKHHCACQVFNFQTTASVIHQSLLYSMKQPFQYSTNFPNEAHAGPRNVEQLLDCRCSILICTIHRNCYLKTRVSR